MTHFATLGAPVRAVLTDDHWSYSHSADVRDVLARHVADHWYIKAHCLWQNGKVERFTRTFATEGAYRRVYLSNEARNAAFTPWLERYNTGRHHQAVGAAAISRLTST